MALSLLFHVLTAAASKVKYLKVIEKQFVSPYSQTETVNALLIIEGNHCVLIYSVNSENKTLLCTLYISLNEIAKYFLYSVCVFTLHDLVTKLRKDLE